MSDETTHERPRRRKAKRTPLAARLKGRPVLGSRDPRIAAPVAAAAVGLLVAVLARVLVFGGERACDAVRGTSTCGSAGGFMLLAIVALMFYVGLRLLRLLAVPEPGVTSILGVTLLSVLILGVLIDQIFSPWMWVVLPLLSAVVYALASWAATRLAATGHHHGHGQG